MNSTRSLSIAAAVALALGAGNAMALDKTATLAAQAAGRSLVVAGASAQRDAFLQLMANDLCASGLDVYRSSAADFRAYSCHTVSSTGAGSIGAALGIAANQDIVVFYRSEGGSAWGPYSIAQRNVQGVAFTGVKSLDVNVCDTTTTNVSFTGVTGTLPTHNCTITGTYALATDGAGVTAGLVDRPTQLGTADVEPKLFTGSNNPAGASSKFSAASNVVSNLKGLASDTGFGQVFTLLLNSTAGSASAQVTNLTTPQATGILTGNIVDWCQISDTLADCGTGGSHPITVVRREPGSGTQVGAGVQFTRAGCGDSWLFVTDHDAPGAADTDGVIEVSTTGTLESTVGNTADAIGINLYKATVGNANTHQVSLDGVLPNRANAASLAYPYAFESTYTKAGTNELPAGSSALAIANGLINVSKQAGRLPNNQAVFAIPSATNIPGTTGSPSTAPVALGTRGGQSCRPFQPQ
jgi:hypothetical protein